MLFFDLYRGFAVNLLFFLFLFVYFPCKLCSFSAVGMDNFFLLLPSLRFS